MTRRLLGYGDEAVLLECTDLSEVLALAGVVRAALPAVREVVPGARTLLLRLDAPLAPEDRQRLLTLAPEPSPADRERTVTLAVAYDGADREEVGALTGWGAEGVVARHCAAEWTVAFCGFAPGFGYLVGPGQPWSVPRRSSPRTTVPAGSVALAGEFTGVYPRASPGGWQLIGRTDLPVFDLGREPPALLVPGTRVRFRDVGGAG